MAEGIPQTIQVYAIWGSAADDVWAAGNAGNVVHWDGVAWSAVPSGTTSGLGSIWGSSASDVWAVGDAGTIIHWNGTAWSLVPSGTTSGLQSVWSSSANDAWAVSDTNPRSGGIAALHWDGSSWTQVLYSSIDFSEFLSSVWGTSASDVWFASFTPNRLARSIAVHWNGAPGPSYLLGDFLSPRLGGSGPIDIWAAVGPNSGSVGWTIFHSNGGAFNPAAGFHLPGYPHFVWASGPNDAWIVGDGGNILRWAGQGWNQVESPTTQSLTGIWGSSAHDIWIVGAGGTLLHRVL